MEAEIEKAFVMHELEEEREAWLSAIATAVQVRTAENVQVVSDHRERLDFLLDELIGVNGRLVAVGKDVSSSK